MLIVVGYEECRYTEQAGASRGCKPEKPFTLGFSQMSFTAT